MNENSTLVTIKGKRYLVENIHLSEIGEISYQLSSVEDVTDEEKKYVDEFVKKLLGF